MKFVALAGGWWGSCSDEDEEVWYDQPDLICREISLPSKHNEGFGFRCARRGRLGLL